MSQRYEKLKKLLKELFQLDQPDLDFGFYRIMHARSADVTQFLDKDLLPQVKAAFAQYRPADKAAIEKDLAKLVAGIEAAGMNPDDSPKVKELRTRLDEEAVDLEALEAEVYDHLYSFFRRYYSEGDFLSKRVYKPGVYAIPYEGEEVKLHWANADQYYIKTSEYLRDYAFRLRPESGKNPMRVHFRLVDAAEGDHGNVKEAAGKERRFKLATEKPLAVENGELVIRFTYEPDPAKQKELNAEAEAAVLAVGDVALANWLQALAEKHVRADGTASEATRLRVHLDRYTARNTFDYFIHKDLGGFLRRELDFYIKNEVMHLDDIENAMAPRVEQYLSKIKVIRRIAGKIIDFLAQIENFQKKLWLKKKFVVETSYCIRLGCIPETFYPEIAANDAQREEWVKLCAIDDIKKDLATVGYSVPLTVEFLREKASLMVDTRHFDVDFTARLMDAIEALDSQTDGVLFSGDNFQALRLLTKRSKSSIQAICVDPPYNTGDDGFLYKDRYQHSAWIAFLMNRFDLASKLLRAEGIVFVHIDDNEYRHLWYLLSDVFGIDNYLGSMVWKRRSASSMSDKPLSLDHEYVLLFARDASSATLHGLSKSESDYPFWDPLTGQRYASTDLTIGMTNEQRPNQFYPITNPRTGKIFQPNPNRVWRFFPETMAQVIAQDLVIWPDEFDGNLQRPRYKTYFQPETMRATPCSSWIETANGNGNDVEQDETKFALDVLSSGMNSEGGRVINRFFEKKVFAYPKPLSLVKSLVRAATLSSDTVLDHFAGSGTTGHAVINLNREDGGRRKFILVEIADYFDTVLLPRLKKVTYTPEWKNGKPKRLPSSEEAERSPRIMKVVRLESYEDTLNNLELRRTETQQGLLDFAGAQGPDKLKEQYILRYLLDVETRGSQSLLNVAAFTDPTGYQLKVKRPGSDESREVNVDLLETFNWLIGLTVQHIAAPQTFTADCERDGEGRLRIKDRLTPKTGGPWWFRTVTGTTPDGRKTLVIWRKRPGGDTAEGIETDNLILDEWFTRQGYSSKDSEFDLIYVNGGNNLENLKAPDDTWKVRLIEEDFFRLMFEMEEV